LAAEVKEVQVLTPDLTASPINALSILAARLVIHTFFEFHPIAAWKEMHT
jgi:hypothetical protein